MTALPLRDFSAAEQDKLAAIEAAPAAAESLRERVARAICAVRSGIPWLAQAGWQQRHYRAMADAAIAVLSGPSSDAEQAVERVQALADELDEEPSDRTDFIDAAFRIREAVRGD